MEYTHSTMLLLKAPLVSMPYEGLLPPSAHLKIMATLVRLINIVEEAERTAKGIEEPRGKRTNQDYRNENNDHVWLRTRRLVRVD